MKRPVLALPAAVRDLRRLTGFLAEKSPAASRKVRTAILKAMDSLDLLSERGRLLNDGGRELTVPFGRQAYFIEYRLDGETVVILRIFHSREDRFSRDDR